MALPVHNFSSHLHFFKVSEIMLLKYGNLILPAGHIQDLYRVRISNAAPFCENYTKLYFDAKQEIFGALFSKKSPLSGQYRTLPEIPRICPDQGHLLVNRIFKVFLVLLLHG